MADTAQCCLSEPISRGMKQNVMQHQMKQVSLKTEQASHARLYGFTFCTFKHQCEHTWVCATGVEAEPSLVKSVATPAAACWPALPFFPFFACTHQTLSASHLVHLIKAGIKQQLGMNGAWDIIGSQHNHACTRNTVVSLLLGHEQVLSFIFFLRKKTIFCAEQRFRYKRKDIKYRRVWYPMRRRDKNP